MKYHLLLTLLLGSLTTFAQTLNLDSGETRALVVGISDYQDEDIPDLRFADKDALAFAGFLQSPAGGSLDEDHLKVLINEKATTGQIAVAMDWLIEQCEEGDQAIIYFSGHGDVETRTIFQRGFLLTYDSPPKNYIAGAFAIIFLQDIVSTLSSNKTQVLIITDACRAGKLAGNTIGGAQLTTANLATKFANEVKILSCQPNEYSIEGERWGGGRGVFSYHLLDGLTGMADINEDLSVNLLEIGRYLEDIVPKETTPQSQIPMTVGNKSSLVARVDSQSLANLKEKKTTETNTLLAVDTKGFVEEILLKADSSIQKRYADFLNTIANGHLLKPKTNSANDYYESLVQEETIAPIHPFIKRRFAAALHDKAQVALNSYLKSNIQEIDKRFDLDSSYFWYPEYLNRAADLLGEDHYLYSNLKGKQYYFEGLLLRLIMYNRIKGQKNFDQRDSMCLQALELQQTALRFEHQAAFIYHEIAILNYSLGNLEVAAENYRKAIELSPGFFFPIEQLASVYMTQSKYKEIQSLLTNAAAYDPKEDKLLKARVLNNIISGEWEEAERLIKKLYIVEPRHVRFWQEWLITVFVFNHKYQEALDTLEKLKESPMRHTIVGFDANYGLANIGLGNFEKGIEIYEHLLPEDQDAFSLVQIGTGYLKMKQYEKADSYFQKALRSAKDKENIKNASSMYRLFWTCANEHEEELALKWLEIILKEGYEDYERILIDNTTQKLRSTVKFKKIMKQYFPEQSKK